MNHYTEMVLREPTVSLTDIQNNDCDAGENITNPKGEQCILGYIKKDYYQSLVKNNLLVNGAEFYFYFYSIKGEYVYSHHPDIFKAKRFCFYINSIDETNSYILEPVMCSVEVNELISKIELVDRLKKQGYDTAEGQHNADFYYILKVKVVDDAYSSSELDVSVVSTQNGNDTYSPHSPKIIIWND